MFEARRWSSKLVLQIVVTIMVIPYLFPLIAMVLALTPPRTRLPVLMAAWWALWFFEIGSDPGYPNTALGPYLVFFIGGTMAVWLPATATGSVAS